MRKRVLLLSKSSRQRIVFLIKPSPFTFLMSPFQTPSLLLLFFLRPASANSIFWQVNNAGVGGANVNVHVLKAQIAEAGAPTDISKIMSDTYEIVEECVTTNYYGVKRMCEAMIPLLQSSASPRIVTIASTMGKLENVSNEWAKGVLSDAENLTEEKIDEVMDEYLKDYRQGSLEAKGWPKVMSAYILSKAAVMALTRVLAKRNKSMIINSVCPGFVKTDINFNTGILSVEQGAASPVKLALVPNGDPSGLFYDRANVSNF
ncbi:PREDICTED: (+)-neomenthol dehydrogenase isoform X2 [Camelina sativa]|uniref:(+)-neomenthol dehydrogenase isoform X2 n=1 Tax=Camelina sativa TaxID=90675 RepID=A0ABM0WQP5_CAMSA|nr:PREDICTED: (+)-neomenthol dehydrogenase isoform X2 [Camelina sativa]